MAYVVNDSCIKCKHLDCVEVCPVDCFYEGENMLVINPDECIDCDMCEPMCPVEAILPDIDSDSPEHKYWLEFNKKYSTEMNWPVITKNGDPDSEHEKYHPDNFPNGKMHLFSDKPGSGN
jgi:ferredoxin